MSETLTPITKENYYNRELDYEYLSTSRFKMFKQNPAAALADLKGDYTWFEDKTALLVGNYLHSHFESPEAHQAFIDENKDLIISKAGKTKGEIKSDYKIADLMIERLEQEAILQNMLRGTEREAIVTGTIDGVPWKGKIDALNVEQGYFIDFKTVKTLVKDGVEWSDELGRRVPFAILRGYHVQMAVYSELLKQMYGKEFTPVIWAVSKQQTPLVKAYTFSAETLQEGMNEVLENQQDVLDVIHGKIEPELIDDGSRFYNMTHRVAPEDITEI